MRVDMATERTDASRKEKKSRFLPSYKKPVVETVSRMKTEEKIYKQTGQINDWGEGRSRVREVNKIKLSIKFSTFWLKATSL